MTPEATQAVRALTQAVEALRDSLASQIPWPAWVQAGATVILVIVTWVYVRHTGRMAKQATESADTAKETLLSGQRPMLSLSHNSAKNYEAGSLVRFDVHVSNRGTGPAIHPDLFAEVTGAGETAKGEVFNKPPSNIMEPSIWPVKYQFQAPSELANERAVQRVLIVCHYEDLPSTAEKPRVYHSVLDEGGARDRLLYLRPGEDLPPDCLRLCKACQPAQTAD
jgi:hypothetical protein